MYFEGLSTMLTFDIIVLINVYSLKEGIRSLFISFDNLFLTVEHPELIKQMDLDTVFPGKKFILNTLFISNFPQKLMGKVMHRL